MSVSTTNHHDTNPMPDHAILGSASCWCQCVHRVHAASDPMMAKCWASVAGASIDSISGKASCWLGACDYNAPCRQWRIQGGWGCGGFKPPPLLRKKPSLYLGVYLWFGDILSEKHCPICLRLHDKSFWNQNFPLGQDHRPLYSIFFGQILPLRWKAGCAPGRPIHDTPTHCRLHAGHRQ